MTRLLLDVTSLARWTGPAVGIARVEHALFRAAQTRPCTELCLWDPPSARFRRLRPEWADIVLGWGGTLDIPDASQTPLSRHRLFAALERIRLTRPALAAIAGRLQDALLAVRRHGHRRRDARGRRIDHVPPDMVLGDPIALGPADTLLCAGANWFHLDTQAVAAAKTAYGFRYACLCYDLIPITHPFYYRPTDVERFTRHWRATLPIADRVIVNARCIEQDVVRFCADEHIPPPEIVVCPLGYDPPIPAAAPPLPLEPGRYALFVSTIEPRKGHAMLFRVWRRLLARGIPQAHRFRLVVVGRLGWMVDDIVADLAAGIPQLDHFQDLDDAALAGLYTHAAFALYPSVYEGFGLPVIEAMAHGKPVLASTGGALPETVAGAYPCLDPDDDDAWEAAIAAWIEQPPAAVATASPLDWPQAAAAILDRAASNVALPHTERLRP